MFYQDLRILNSSFSKRMTESRGKPVVLEIRLLTYNIDNRVRHSDTEPHCKSNDSRWWWHTPLVQELGR